MSKSRWEAQLAIQIKAAGLPEPDREVQFMPTRRFRFDFAWWGPMVAAEVEGGTWIKGRHTRGTGFEADTEKYNLAMCDGWRVFRFTPNYIQSGEAIRMLERVLVDENSVGRN